MTPSDADQIHIEQLEVQARIGVPEEERAQPQRLAVSVTFTPRRAFHGLDDDLAQTIDYAVVCEEIKSLVSQRPRRLLETLADELAAHLLATFPIARIRVEVRKFILPDTRHVAVVVIR